MKHIMPLIIAISLILSGCQNTPTPTPITFNHDQNQLPTGFLHADGQRLVNAAGDQSIRLRAINFTHEPGKADYVDARTLGFNAVRLVLQLDTFTGYSWLDTQIGYAKEAGVYLILGLNADQSKLWEDPSKQEAILAFWSDIAEKYATESTIAAYDMFHTPTPQDLDQWQSLAQNIGTAIRASDSNHPLIVQAALVPDRTFIYIDDANYILGFDFFKPYEFTAYHQGQYPNSDLFQPAWDDFRLTNNYISNPKLAAGTTDWTESGASHNLLVDRETMIGIPGITCTNLLGSAWFSNFMVREYDESDRYLQDIQTIDLAHSSFWAPWSGDNSAIIEKVDGDPWGEGGQSIRFAPRQEGQPASGTNADPNFGFEAIPGHSYAISGWMRGENVNPDASCKFNIEFYSYAGRDQLMVWDKEHIQREMQHLLHYGQYHQLPMMLVDFGLTRDSLENGGDVWSTDMFDLLDESFLSYAWKSYRDNQWGIYSTAEGEAANSKLVSLFQRADPLAGPATKADIEVAIPTTLVDGFVHTKGTDLVVGTSESPIYLSGINFNNDLYTNNFPFMPHHARRDFFEVRNLGFNVIRFNLTHQWFTDDAGQGWAWLDQQVAWAKEAGVYLIINMHYVPGQDIWSISYEPESQQQTADLWQTLADRYKNETIIAGYDLLNEPHDVEATVYQAYMQKVVNAIREVDTNHMIVVEAINEYTPRFVTVQDGNVMYDFHFYHPGDITHENTGDSLGTSTYPDEDYLELRWDRLQYLGSPRTSALPTGSTDWVLYESPSRDSGLSAGNQGFGVPKIFCNQNKGRAYFGDIQILAQNGTTNTQVILDLRINSETPASSGSDSGLTIFGLSPQNPNNSPEGRSLTVRSSTNSTWVEFIQDAFEVQPGTNYQIKGWMKGDDISSGADCHYLIEFFQLGTQDTLLRHNRDFLAERLTVGLQFREQNQVPINVGEFGAFQTNFLSPEAGGVSWTNDILDLLIENHINFAYWDYHGSWGLYPDLWHYPDPADINTLLWDVFLDKIK